MTAATEQAALLRAIADHLDHHPHLRQVIVGGSTGLQLHYTSFGEPDHSIAGALVGWARSLDIPAIELLPVRSESIAPTKVHGQVRADVDGHLVRVWAPLGTLVDAERSVIPVDELDELIDQAATAAASETPAVAPDTATAPREDPA